MAGDPRADRLGAVRVDYDGEGLSEDRCPAAPLPIVRAWVEAVPPGYRQSRVA